MPSAEEFLNQYAPQPSGPTNAADFLANYEPTPQYKGVMRGPAQFGSAFLKGVTNVINTPGNVGAALDKYVGKPVSKAITGKEYQGNPIAGLLGGTPDYDLELGRHAGLIDNPTLAPQNYGEKLNVAAGQGVGGTLPLALATGGASTIPDLAANAAVGATSGMGSQSAYDLWPEELPGKNSLAPILGALVGGGAAGAAIQTGSKIANAATGNMTNPTLEAYKQAGITPRLAGDVTGEPFWQQTQALAKKMPIGAGMVEDAAKKTLDEFGNAVEDTASKIGKSVTLQEAGNALQAEGKTWLNRFKTEGQQHWDAVDNAIGKNTAVPLSSSQQALATITAPAQGNRAMEKFLQSPIAQQFKQIIKTSKTGQVPWETARALKTRIGEYLANPELVADAGGAQAKMLYGAISNDMKSSLVGNPDALARFDQANAFTSKGHEFIDNFLSNISGKGIAPEQAAAYALNSGVRGGTTLQALRQEMPEGVNQLASAAMRRGSMAQPSGQNAIGNRVSPDSWLNTYDPTRRMAPEAFEALFPSKEIQAKMGALDTVAGSMRDSAKYVNASNSGGHLGTLLALSAPIEGAIAGAATGGTKGAVLGTLAGSVPPLLGVGSGLASTSPALTKFLSSPSYTAPAGWTPALTGGALGTGNIGSSPSPDSSLGPQSALDPKSQIIQGVLQNAATPGDFRKYVQNNKAAIKTAFGGQGLNNLERVASANWRSAPDNADKLSFFERMKSGNLAGLPIISQAMKKNGIETLQHLQLAAATNPSLTDMLSKRVPMKASNSYQRRIAAALGASEAA